MNLTNDQARNILLGLYIESLNPNRKAANVINSARSSAIWKACEVLKEKARESGAKNKTKPAPKGEHQQQD